MISYSSRLLFRVKVSIFSICFCFPPLGVKSFTLRHICENCAKNMGVRLDCVITRGLNGENLSCTS